MPGPALITGVAGFIGSHLARALLESGVRVVGLDNFDPFYSREKKEANLDRVRTDEFEFVEADILDASAMVSLVERVRPECIFHIAALAGVRPSIEQPARYAAVNVEGLINVLEAARQSSCRFLLFASSSSVYGNNRKVPFAEDDDVSRPISPYAATKRAGEMICETYAHLYGLAIASLRFFTVFGPAQRPDLAIAKFMRRIALGEEIEMFGDGSSSRDYTYIDDIVKGILAARDRVRREQRSFHRIYNLGGSHPTTLRDMISSIEDVVGRKAMIRKLPMQPGDVDRTFADLSRSRAELGYEPKTDFRTGLEHQWRSMSNEISI